MADSTEGDTGVQDLGVLASALITLIAGLVIHSFIIGVNVNDWWKGRSVTPVDLTVTSLGISRLCSQCTITLGVFLHALFLRDLDSYVTALILGRIYAFFAYANVWLTTLLSIVFCLKISNLQTRLFLFLRGMILQRTGYFIIASVLPSAFNSLVTLLSITKVASGGIYNTTRDNLFTDCIHINSIYSATIGAITPLLFYYISFVLLFTSLYHHTTRMKRSSNLTINLETYYSAMKFVSFIFIYNTIYFIVHFVSVFYYYFHCVDLPWLHIIFGILPGLHSSYLIFKTAKLRNQMSKVRQNIIDFFIPKERKRIKRKNIEVVSQ